MNQFNDILETCDENYEVVLLTRMRKIGKSDR
jgi:hypothetical protein